MKEKHLNWKSDESQRGEAGRSTEVFKCKQLKVQYEKSYISCSLVDIQIVVLDLDGNGTKWSETECLNWYWSNQFLHFFLYFSINVTIELCYWAECNFHFLFAVVLQESLQTDLNNQLNSIFSEIGNSNGLSFNILYAQVDRDRVDESFANCELVQEIYQRVFDKYARLKVFLHCFVFSLFDFIFGSCDCDRYYLGSCLARVNEFSTLFKCSICSCGSYNSTICTSFLQVCSIHRHSWCGNDFSEWKRWNEEKIIHCSEMCLEILISKFLFFVPWNSSKLLNLMIFLNI